MKIGFIGWKLQYLFNCLHMDQRASRLGDIVYSEVCVPYEMH